MDVNNLQIPEPTENQIKYEKRSLDLFCSKYDLSVDRYIEIANSYNQGNRERSAKALGLFELLQNPNLISKYQSLIGKGFWQSTRNIEYLSRLNCIPAYLKVAESKFITDSHLNYLLEYFNITKSSNRNLNIENILKTVPCPTDFDLRFNGVVGKHKKLGLCVCIYPHLFEVLNWTVNLLMQIAFKRVQGIEVFRGFSEISTIAGEFYYREAFLSLAKWAKGETYTAKFDERALKGTDIRNNYNISLAAEGGKRFVRFHEFNHLFFGHLESSPDTLKEIDADSFALAALILSNPDENNQTMMAVGVASFFGILSILEDLGIGEGSYHLKSKERVEVLSSKLRFDKIQTMYNVFRIAWERANKNMNSIDNNNQLKFLKESSIMAEIALERHSDKIPKELQKILNDVKADKLGSDIALKAIGAFGMQTPALESEFLETLEWEYSHNALPNRLNSLGKQFIKNWIKEFQNVICKDKSSSKVLKDVSQSTFPAMIAGGLLNLGISDPLALSVTTIALYTVTKATKGTTCKMNVDEILNEIEKSK